ncbi:MAG: hypothetical protein R3C14_34750 [Caldilineaceae bacterium]
MMNGFSYQTLLTTFMPRPITDEEQYSRTVEQVNRLIDKGDLSVDERDYLTLLGTLVMAYESEQYPDEMFELHGIALVRALMEEEGIKQSDLLPIFKTRSIASAVLNGKRKLTVEHIDALANYFNLPHELFFDLQHRQNRTKLAVG